LGIEIQGSPTDKEKGKRERVQTWDERTRKKRTNMLYKMTYLELKKR
jgi:hypothetical protein